MKKKFELFILWLIETIIKLSKLIGLLLFIFSMYIFPIIMIIYEEDNFFIGFYWIWCFLIYSSTIAGLTHEYYEYLKKKYKK